MRKGKYIVLTIVISYFIIRFLFSYTILEVPYMFGTETYCGGAKYNFPICVINPFKKREIKESIYNQIIGKDFKSNIEDITSFRQEVDSLDSLELISISRDKNYDYFLLEIQNKRYVVITEKGTQHIVQIRV